MSNTGMFHVCCDSDPYEPPTLSQEELIRWEGSYDTQKEAIEEHLLFRKKELERDCPGDDFSKYLENVEKALYAHGGYLLGGFGCSGAFAVSIRLLRIPPVASMDFLESVAVAVEKEKMRELEEEIDLPYPEWD